MNEKKAKVNNESAPPREGTDIFRCSDFKPEEHFIEIPGFGDSSEKNVYLEVKWRVWWFIKYCRENGIRHQIRELPGAFIPGTNLYQAACEVYMDGELVGTGCGGSVPENDSPAELKKVVQSAETIAKGRALANAGFGTIFTLSGSTENGGAEYPCDAGLRSSEFFVMSNPKNPMQVSVEAANTATAETSAKSGNTTEGKASAASATTVSGTENKLESREDALRFVIQVPGSQYNGETMSEVVAKSPNSVRYYATKKQFSGTDLQKAAKLVLGMA